SYPTPDRCTCIDSADGRDRRRGPRATSRSLLCPRGCLLAVRILFRRRAARPLGGDLVGPDDELRESRGAECGRERAVHGIAAATDHNSADARRVVPSVERVPATTNVG